MVLVFLKHLFLPSKHPLLPTDASPKYGSTSTRPSCCPRRPSSQKPKGKPYLQPRVLSDLTIGLSDGLTVPFALTAGLSAFNDTQVVLYGGLAELIAGSISMGLGGWLAGRGEAAVESNKRNAARRLAASSPEAVRPRLLAIFDGYGVPGAVLEPVVESLLGGEEEDLVRFVTVFQERLAAEEGGEGVRTPVSSALTIAAGYFFGGFVPLVPYVFVDRGEVLVGLRWSVVVMVVCLFVFGGGKTVLVDHDEEKWTGGRREWGEVAKGGVEMVVVGGVAAAAAMGIVRVLGGMS